MICIFSPAGSLTGGTYRSLKSILGFPSGEYRLYMPGDVKKSLMDDIRRLVGDSAMYGLVSNAVETEPLGVCRGKWRCYVKYGEKLATRLVGEGCGFVYIPHEHPYIPLGIGKHLPWAVLLQTTPVVGSLAIEDGSGFILFWRNMRAVYKAKPWKILRSYMRLKAYGRLIAKGAVLAVSRSIPYELAKLGIRGNIEVLHPGVGVDPCAGAPPESRDIDLVFFARLRPEKGIYDYISVVKKLQEAHPSLTAVAAGLADEATYKQVKAYADKLGVKVEIIPNVERAKAFEILGRSKIAVYPSKMDAFPLAVLESLSCGTPVVAYNIPAIRLNFDTKAVIKTPTGLIEQMANAVLDALNRYHVLSREAATFARVYTWDKVSSVEWQKIVSLAKSSRKAPPP